MAIQSYAGGTFHIWTMHPDGSGLKQLTKGHGDDREPKFSPDGKTIAFSSDRAFKGSYDIWTVDMATGAVKQVTSSDLDEYEPNWTPDGSGIVFASGTGIAAKSIELIDLASRRQNTVAAIDPAAGRVDAPSFSPDGKSLAYVQFSGAGMFLNSARLVVTTAGSSAPIYTGKADDAFPFAATWLSNSELIYTGSGHIYRTDLAGKSEVAIPFQRDDQVDSSAVCAQGVQLRLDCAPYREGDLGACALARWKTGCFCGAQSDLSDEDWWHPHCLNG